MCIVLESVLWILMHVAPIKNHSQQVVLYLCQFKDITAWKQPIVELEGEEDTITGILQNT